MSSTAYHAPKAGYYVCASQLRIDRMSRSYYVRALIAINGDRDAKTGLHTKQGNRGSTNYRTLQVAGTVYLDKADSVSVYVYTNGDNDWQVQHESGFSCQMLPTFSCTKCPAGSTGASIEAGCACDDNTAGEILPSKEGRKYTGSCKPCGKNYGFNADSAADIYSGAGWQEMSDWRTSGTKYGELYDIGPGSELKNGRYVAPQDGYYLCSTNLRLDAVAQSSFMRLVVAVNGVDLTCNSPTCGKTSGFNADLRTNLLQSSKSNQWIELTDWNLRLAPGLYSSDGEFSQSTGRFSPISDGYYLCSANVRIDSFSATYTRLVIGINGDHDPHNGMSVTMGDGKSSNYFSQMVSGNIYMKKGQYASVWFLGNGDNSYYIKSESGFSCHRLLDEDDYAGFRADMTQTTSMGVGWKELGLFRVSDEPGLYSIGSKIPLGNSTNRTVGQRIGFNPGSGRFYAPPAGMKAGGTVYYCSANVRFDGANSKGFFHMSIRHDAEEDLQNGMHVMSGNYFSTNQGSLQLAGTIKIKTFVSVWVDSSQDNTWTVSDESGFGCHRMLSDVGFHADMITETTYNANWKQIANWRTNGNDELYGAGALNDSGEFVVPYTGFYFCSASVKIASISTSYYSQLVISIDGSVSGNQGLYTITGNRGSTDNRFMTVAGTVRLEKDQAVSVQLYSNDGSWTPKTESGFSCHLLGHAPSNVIHNFEDRINNGFAVIDGDAGGTTHRNLGVSGVVKMAKGDFTSVFVYSHNDNDYHVDTQSGFSCHKLSSTVGFHADLAKDSQLGTSWHELQHWRTTGYPSLYSTGNSFNAALGKFRILSESAYYCYAQVRLDTAARNEKRLLLARNGETDTNTGFSVIQSNYGSQNYRSMRVAGNAWFKSGDSVSLYLYSKSDDYTAQSESGFGCHQLSTKFGFHADLTADVSFGNQWRRVENWRIGGNEFLYSNGGGFSGDGYFSAPEDGYYVCSAMIRMDSADNGRQFNLLISVNDNQDGNNGLQSTTSHGSSDYRYMITAGTLYLKEREKVSVWLFSNGDNSWKVQTESGFGCHLMQTYTDC